MPKFTELSVGGSGGGILIEVNELPTANIDESKIYLVNKTEISANVYMCESGAIMNVSDLGLTTVIVKSISDVTNPSPTDMYVIEDTGYSYMYMPDMGLMSMADMTGMDYGYVNELPPPSDGMWACAIKGEKNSFIVGVPNETQNKNFSNWNGQKWETLTMPFEVPPKIDFGDGVVFSLEGIYFYKIKNDSVEYLQHVGNEWTYEKTTAHSQSSQGSNSAFETKTNEDFYLMIRIGNSFACMDSHQGGVNTVTKINSYWYIEISKDATTAYQYWNEDALVGKLERTTLAEWNAKIAELGITTT